MSYYKFLTAATFDDLIDIIATCESKRHVLRKYGFKTNDPRGLKYLNAFIIQYNVNIDHFNHKPYKRKYTDAQVEIAVQTSRNFTEVLTKLHLSIVGGNKQTIERIIKRNNLSIKHFKNVVSTSKHTIETALVKNSNIHKGCLRRLIITHNVLPYQCNHCGINTIWNNQPITLELDHINGDRYDNRLQNLRFLCPNCHSQTTTFRGKNNGGKGGYCPH